MKNKMKNTNQITSDTTQMVEKVIEKVKQGENCLIVAKSCRILVEYIMPLVKQKTAEHGLMFSAPPDALQFHFHTGNITFVSEGMINQEVGYFDGYNGLIFCDNSSSLLYSIADTGFIYNKEPIRYMYKSENKDPLSQIKNLEGLINTLAELFPYIFSKNITKHDKIVDSIKELISERDDLISDHDDLISDLDNLSDINNKQMEQLNLVNDKKYNSLRLTILELGEENLKLDNQVKEGMKIIQELLGQLNKKDVENIKLKDQVKEFEKFCKSQAKEISKVITLLKNDGGMSTIEINGEKKYIPSAFVHFVERYIPTISYV